MSRRLSSRLLSSVRHSLFALIPAAVESGVDAQREDAGISEDTITDRMCRRYGLSFWNEHAADTLWMATEDRKDIDQDNIVSGERSTRSDVNYAEADDKADAAVEDTAGISVE